MDIGGTQVGGEDYGSRLVLCGFFVACFFSGIASGQNWWD